MNSNQQILFSHSIISPLGKKIHQTLYNRDQTTYREVIFWPMGQYFLLALCNV